MRFFRKGQLSIAVLASIIGPFLLASVGLAWNAITKSDKALEEVSAVKADVREIKTDVRWIRESISQRVGLASSSQPINGHR